ncbi:hypothetical protein D3C72_2305740 [compost metagenome]
MMETPPALADSSSASRTRCVFCATSGQNGSRLPDRTSSANVRYRFDSCAVVWLLLYSGSEIVRSCFSRLKKHPFPPKLSLPTVNEISFP